MDLFKTNGASPPQPDFKLSDQGTLFLLQPLTQAARAWVDEYLPEDAFWFGGSVVVEHRFIGDLVRGAIADGLEVR